MKCLKCGGRINHRECCELETWGDKHVEYWVGTCANCETVHQWEETYLFADIEDLRIVDYSETAECKG